MVDRTQELVDFYDALAPMFDVMTDWGARLTSEGPFLQGMLAEVNAERVLDAACGSGGHALALAQWGYDVVGADVSPVMIALAEEKAAAAGLDVPFVVAGLADLTSQPPSLVGKGFDVVLCLGNSLPHLLTQDELVTALQGMAGVLRPGGLLIMHNLNYDLRWRTRPRWFAAQGGLLDGREVLVWRFADYDETAGRIAFHIALFQQAAGDWEVAVHTTPQRPLFRADLVAALDEAGCGDMRAFGQMKWPATTFDPERSPDLVLVARKK